MSMGFSVNAGAASGSSRWRNRGRYSPFFRCGYSPDQDGGCGNNNDNSGPFTSCDYSRASCVERGMFDHDSSGRETRRFGGVEFRTFNDHGPKLR